MKYDFFICCSFEDRAYAEELIRILSVKYGISCWIDTQDTVAADSYYHQIKEAIDASNAVVTVLSASSMECVMLQNVLAYAVIKNKKIHALCIDKIPLNPGMAFKLRTGNILNLTDCPPEKCAEKLAAIIEKNNTSSDIPSVKCSQTSQDSCGSAMMPSVQENASVSFGCSVPAPHEGGTLKERKKSFWDIFHRRTKAPESHFPPTFQVPKEVPGDTFQPAVMSGGTDTFTSALSDAEAKPPAISRVQFSAVSPDTVKIGEYFTVNLFMYEDEYRSAVDEVIRAYSEKVKEARSGYLSADVNARVRMVLTSPDLNIDDGEEERIWYGGYVNFAFVVSVPENYKKTQISFCAAVYINDMIAAKLRFLVSCNHASHQNINISREDFVSAFVSYASQDRHRVASIVQGMKKARPDMDIFFDVESLRSGQTWENVLKNEIARRDILFLCWSEYASKSEWVDMEWRYALQCNGEDSIEPIPIDPPDICPPPMELQQKHFNDRMLYIIKATASVKVPYLYRIKTRERISLQKPLFRLGKAEDYADYRIIDNRKISSHHADIHEQEGQYYIVDTNSTNHTYVDGKMLFSGENVLLTDGAKIRLADEEFIFVAY